MYKLPRILGIIAATASAMAVSQAAFAESRISILVAGEAYEGMPSFEVSLGGKVVGKGTLTRAIDTVKVGRLFFNPEPESYLETFDFTIDDADFDPDGTLSVSFVNDKFLKEKWGYDRNLFIRSIEVNGTVVRSGQLRLTDGAERRDDNYQAGYLPIYHQNHMAVATPPEGGWPKNAQTLSSRIPAEIRAASGAGG
jgi:hypothetical protein